MPLESVLVQLLLSIFAHDLCSVTRYDDVRILHEIKSPYDSWLLQSDTNSVRTTCSYVSKKTVSYVCRK